MIAKGLHFPQVTLVGVLNSDSGLNIPDFRASETVFQLLTQVAGRSGRGAIPGEVLIQTALPDNPTIQHAAAQDFVGFYKEEINVRELFRYPPFSRIAKLLFSGKNAQQTQSAAENIRRLLIQALPQNFEFNPVIPCGYTKVKDQYRYQFILRGPSLLPLNAALQSVQEKSPLSAQVKLFLDIDPSSTFF